jgi:hypothetical protein
MFSIVKIIFMVLVNTLNTIKNETKNFLDLQVLPKGKKYINIYI